MNRLTQTITLLLLLVASTASAQRAVILELPNGQYVGLVFLADGTTVLVPTVQVIKLPTPDPTPPPVTTTVDRVTYVYEKDQGGVPPNVRVALNKLNEGRKILASEFEDDTKDGTGDVPEQYKIALEESKRAGIPCLVVQSGSRVVRVVKVTPQMTLQQILEAAK